VTNRLNLVVVYTRDSVHGLRHVVDFPEYILSKNVPLLHGEHDIDVVRSTKLGGKAEVHLHERMPIG